LIGIRAWKNLGGGYWNPAWFTSRPNEDVTVENSVFADNGVGVAVTEYSSSMRLRNTVFYGYTRNVRSPSNMTSADQLADWHRDNVFGGLPAVPINVWPNQLNLSNPLLPGGVVGVRFSVYENNRYQRYHSDWNGTR
jgi:hypothetical protein